MTVDYSYLKEVSRGDESLFDTLITILYQELYEAVEDIETHVKENDMQSLDRVAHTLKNKFNMVGADDVADELKNIRNRFSEKVYLDEDINFLTSQSLELAEELKMKFSL